LGFNGFYNGFRVQGFPTKGFGGLRFSMRVLGFKVSFVRLLDFFQPTIKSNSYPKKSNSPKDLNLDLRVDKRVKGLIP
jgi:hypothetical protein